MGDLQNMRITKNATMSSADGLSNAVDLEGYRVSALDFSSGWDAVNRVTFQGGEYGTATSPVYRNLYDRVGIEWQVSSGQVGSATGFSVIPDADLSLAISAHRYLRLRAGPATASATPSTAVTISLVLVPL